ncbi:hypothetical protein M758_1G304000 [Ceratodon purpureus]|nr:hypothetical protein M758_1G304000 [Ceratodon purpureus]
MSQVEQARAGIDALADSQHKIGSLRENFELIDRLCRECQTLIEHHDQIKLLSNARNNLNTTLKDVEGMMSISTEAAEARASLSDERELLRTFEALTALEQKRRFALATVSTRREEAGKLTEYFEDVSNTRAKFEQTLWGHVGNFFQLARDSPQTLVRALRYDFKDVVVKSNEALSQAVEVIFEDPGVKELISKLYQKDWYEGLVTEYLVATFTDYFGDVKLYVEERSYKRFAEACLETTIVLYVDRLLTQKGHIKEETLKRLEVDEEVLGEFFREIITPAKVDKRILPLAELRDLASAESVDAFTEAYAKLLQNHPDCPPEVVEKLVALRDDIPKKDAKEVVGECKALYNEKLNHGELPKPGLVFSRLTCLPKARLGRK